jgi:hypothetical protein
MKRLSFILVLMSLVFLSCSNAIMHSSGSSVNVDLSYERYSPQFQIDKYSALKNKKLFLSSFTNNANNTTVFYYFSPDFKIKYGQYAIASYYWYCFAKAFNRIGMTTYQDNAPSDIPEFTFKFDYLTDQKIIYQVIVNKRYNVVYQRNFEVTMPASGSEDKNFLENRAYQMMDSIITNILDDPNFAAAL